MKTVLNKTNVDTTQQPMFLGEDLALQRYDTPKYPKFLDLYDKQWSNFWRPSEVSLVRDRADYEALTPVEKSIFEKNLRWQTMTDSMLSRSIHEMTKYISLPELEAACNVWAAFETIHSQSYTWILQNITKNPKAFFDSILEDKEIVKRADEISAAYDNLLGDDTRKDIKQKLFEAIIATQITEGVSFYSSFACTWYFGFRGKMEGNAKIISLIERDENLHVAITANILKNWRDNPDEGFQEVVKRNEQLVYDMYKMAAENEKKWIKYLFEEGSLLGLNEALLGGYIEWLTNTRLTSLGYKKIYTNAKTNPIAGWLDSFTDSSKVQVAPQETEISSYLIGARDTSISETDFNDISLD